MPRGKPLVPTPLDRFLEVDFACLQKVLQTGRIDINFGTDNQAINTKARLWRLRNSLLYYRPNEELSIAAKTFVFKRQGSNLTIIRREQSPEVAAQLAALRVDAVIAIADPQEQEIAARAAQVEAAERELRELTQSGVSQDDEADTSRD